VAISELWGIREPNSSGSQPLALKNCFINSDNSREQGPCRSMMKISWLCSALLSRSCGPSCADHWSVLCLWWTFHADSHDPECFGFSL
jgi:hypothetical protein